MSESSVRDFAESARMGSGVDGNTAEAINQLTMGAAPEQSPDRLIEITNDIQWGKTRQRVALGILAERERCAKIADGWAEETDAIVPDGETEKSILRAQSFTARIIAFRIRSGK